MSRIHGRRGRVYLQIASADTAAQPLPFTVRWSIVYATDKAEVTAMGDSNKVYVAGIPDASGEFSGWYDDATAQTYKAARDGIARKFYLYPDLNDTSKYHYGTILPDFTISGAVDGAVEVSASWNAADTVQRSDQ